MALYQGTVGCWKKPTKKGAKSAPIVYFAQKLYILTQDIDYILFRHFFLLYFFIYHVARCQLAVNIFK